MRTLAIVCVFSLVPVLMGGQDDARRTILTDAEVQTAIDRGLASKPVPRELRFHPEHSVIAVAYSPEVRIGLLAKHGRDNGAAVSVASVPTTVRERLVFIAMRGDFPKPPPGVRLSDPETTLYIEHKAPRKASLTDAVWVSRNPDSVLRLFGATLPYSDIEMIGAFPISAVYEGDYVIANRRYPDIPNLIHVWVARFTREDVDALQR